jgi:hypothetical protein
MMPNIKELTSFDNDLNPKIQVPTHLPAASTIEDDKESQALEEHEYDEHSSKVPNLRIPRSGIVFERNVKVLNEELEEENLDFTLDPFTWRSSEEGFPYILWRAIC